VKEGIALRCLFHFTSRASSSSGHRSHGLQCRVDRARFVATRAIPLAGAVNTVRIFSAR
jgi:hypothetical protein